MYAIGDINGALVLNWVQRSSIGKFDSAEIDLNISTRSPLSIPDLAIEAYTDAADSCGVDLGALTSVQTAAVNASLLWKIAADFANEALKTDGECDDCPMRHAEFIEYACGNAKVMLDRVSECMSGLLGFNCSINDLPDIFNISAESDCECP